MQDRKIIIFEFSDHARQIQHIETFITENIKFVDIECYLHKSNLDFLRKDYIQKVRIENSYFLLIKLALKLFSNECKIIINSAPEFSNLFIKINFTLLLILSQFINPVFIIIRDWKKSRGYYFNQALFIKKRRNVFCENEYNFRYLSKKYLISGYIYPSPYRNSLREKLIDKSNISNLKIFLTGSLDENRRDYYLYFEALKKLKTKHIELHTIIGGHCLSKSAPKLLRKIKALSFKVSSFKYMDDDLFDNLILNSDILLCLNRKNFYSGIKGTGALGDAFFAGKKLVLLESKNKIKEQNIINKNCLYFQNSEQLIKIILKVKKNRNYLNASIDYINEMENYFKSHIEKFLKA